MAARMMLNPARQALVLCAVTALTMALPARAGLFDDTEARTRIDQLRQQMSDQLGSMGQRLDEAQKNQMDFANQMDGLRSDMSKLRGQIEELNYNLELTQKRQKDFYLDLDNRLRKLEGAAATSDAAAPGASAGATANGAGATPPADPNAEARDYEAAAGALKAGRYKESGNAFLAFIKAYPNSSLLPGAHFWAGAAFVRNREPVHGAELFGKLAATWPNDAKAPEALYQQSQALESVGDKAGARKALDLLLGKYPESEAAKQVRASQPAAKKK